MASGKSDTCGSIYYYISERCVANSKSGKSDDGELLHQVTRGLASG